MALTRRQGTLIGIGVAFITILFVLWMYYSIGTIGTSLEEAPERPVTIGPNPDGSWGEWPGPFVKVVGSQINTRTEEIIIFLIVGVGTDKKYLSHITLPVDGIVREAE